MERKRSRVCWAIYRFYSKYNKESKVLRNRGNCVRRKTEQSFCRQTVVSVSTILMTDGVLCQEDSVEESEDNSNLSAVGNLLGCEVCLPFHAFMTRAAMTTMSAATTAVPQAVSAVAWSRTRAAIRDLNEHPFSSQPDGQCRCPSQTKLCDMQASSSGHCATHLQIKNKIFSFLITYNNIKKYNS